MNASAYSLYYLTPHGYATSAMGDTHYTPSQMMNYHHPSGEKRPPHTNPSRTGTVPNGLSMPPQKRPRVTQRPAGAFTVPKPPRLYNSTPVDTILNHPEYGPLPEPPIDERELHRREVAFHTRYPGNKGYQIGDTSPTAAAQSHSESVSPRCLSPQSANDNTLVDAPAGRRSIIEISGSDDEGRDVAHGESEPHISDNRSRTTRQVSEANQPSGPTNSRQAAAVKAQPDTPRTGKPITEGDWYPSSEYEAASSLGAEYTSDSPTTTSLIPARHHASRTAKSKKAALKYSDQQLDGSLDSTGSAVAADSTDQHDTPAEPAPPGHEGQDEEEGGGGDAAIAAPRWSVKPAPSRRGKHSVKRDGYSMTPNAIDYRARKRQEAALKARLEALLDPDIVAGVAEEGWETPLGRLLKAVVRQLEGEGEGEGEGVRGQGGERESESDREGEEVIRGVRAENERLRKVLAKVQIAVARVDVGAGP